VPNGGVTDKRPAFRRTSAEYFAARRIHRCGLPATHAPRREAQALQRRLQRLQEVIMSTLPTSVIAALLLLSAGDRPAAQVPPLAGCPAESGTILQDVVATQTFQERVEQYVLLHRLLEGPLPPVTVAHDLTPVRDAMRLLRMRIQRARLDAQPGDIITPDVGRMFRRNIAACLTRAEWAAIFADMAEDEQAEPVPPPPVLHVNMAWPEQALFDFVPPQLLQVLPPLPPELQYRVIGRTLVLWDHHADLIIDVLPGAFVNES
jgi:hypothetical protein